MQYRSALLIPAGTLADAPAESELSICYGRLKRYVLFFPAGHAGKAHVQVWYHGRQILPTTLGSSFLGDDLVIDSPDGYPLFDGPYELLLRGWAPDATYDHIVYCQFYIEADLLTLPAALGSQSVEIPVFEE